MTDLTLGVKLLRETYKRVSDTYKKWVGLEGEAVGEASN